MSTPDDRKTLRVSPDTHARILAHARRIRGTVDEAVTDLADPSTVRVPMTETQRERWEIEADKRGLALGEFVSMAVEAHMMYNPRTINQIFYRVEALTKAAGIPVPPIAIPVVPPNSAPQD